MISNRKARLLLGVPAVRVGLVKYYRLTNNMSLYYLGEHQEVVNKARLRRERKEAVRRAVYDSLLPHVGKPMSALANMDLSALEERLAATYAPGAAENYALSIGRQIHVEAEKIVSESPDLSITLLDGAGKPVADVRIPDTYALARKVIDANNECTEYVLRRVIAERYGDVDLEAFAKDSLRKCWPDRDEYFYKDDLLLTVHKPRWDEITFEIHRGPKNGN